MRCAGCRMPLRSSAWPSRSRSTSWPPAPSSRGRIWTGSSTRAVCRRTRAETSTLDTSPRSVTERSRPSSSSYRDLVPPIAPRSDRRFAPSRSQGATSSRARCRDSASTESVPVRPSSGSPTSCAATHFCLERRPARGRDSGRDCLAVRARRRLLARGRERRPQCGRGRIQASPGHFTGIWLIAALLPTTVGAAQTRAFLTAAALGLALYAAVGPLLLAAWTRTDYVRFVWIVSQGASCSSMGGGPGMLWVLGTSLLVAIAATAHAVTSGLTVRRATAGLGLGLAVRRRTVLASVPAPALLACALGCVL